MATIKKKRKPKQTLAEFRAWLLGVEELQPEAWSPNRDQWLLIRERIDKIIEPAPEIIHAQKGIPAPNKPVERTLPPGFIPAPPMVGGIPTDAIIEQGAQVNTLTVTAPEMPNQGTAPRSVTPNIDTTDGNYKSGFI